MKTTKNNERSLNEDKRLIDRTGSNNRLEFDISIDEIMIKEIYLGLIVRPLS
jgi:hypothetical protein